MKNEATNKDQLAAYYYARLLDAELMKMYESKEPVCYDLIQNCIRRAELKFSQVNIDNFSEALCENEWSLDYIYLDRKKNLYEFKLEHVETVTPPVREDSETL